MQFPLIKSYFADNHEIPDSWTLFILQISIEVSGHLDTINFTNIHEVPDSWTPLSLQISIVVSGDLATINFTDIHVVLISLINSSMDSCGWDYPIHKESMDMW